MSLDGMESMGQGSFDHIEQSIGDWASSANAPPVTQEPANQGLGDQLSLDYMSITQSSTLQSSTQSFQGETTDNTSRTSSPLLVEQEEVEEEVETEAGDERICYGMVSWGSSRASTE